MNRFWSQIPPAATMAGKVKPDARDRDAVVMEQRPRNRDPEHNTHEGPGLEGSAVRDLEPAPGDDDGRETAPQLVAERQHVGRRATDHGIEHDVQEPLEVLELIRGDLGRDVRIDRLRGRKSA